MEKPQEVREQSPSRSEPRQRNNQRRMMIFTRIMTSLSCLSTLWKVTWAPSKKLRWLLGSQPALHDSLLRYVTETKYLIDLVPTQKEIVGDKWATKAVPEQSLSSSTTSSLETEDEGGNADQDPADWKYFEQMEVDYKGTEGTREDVGSWLQDLPPHPPTGGRPAAEWRGNGCLPSDGIHPVGQYYKTHS